MVRSGKEVYLADDVSIIVSEINNFAYYKASGGCARILQGNIPLSAAKIRRSKRQNEKSFVVYYIIAYKKKTGESTRTVKLLCTANVNELLFPECIPAEVITFLDPTIESLHFDKKGKRMVIYLKLKGREEIVLNDVLELNNYLSSGTVRGMIIFTRRKAWLLRISRNL